MRAFIRKTVLVLLVLSLNLIPFRGVMAGPLLAIDDGSSHEGMAHDPHSAEAVVGNMSDDNCHLGQLSSDGGCCTGDACSLSHCASTAYLVPSQLIDLSITASAVQAIFIDQSILQQADSPPFRPPRL
ncbi:MAG: hypothetical protein N0E48_16870 [Candidatus Thiodiazotropha endolucinida]|nr:hypothetical protein [Candidatus Thiodiazotropha endolucinida]